MRRALTNLIGNALNQGKSATLNVQASPETIRIFVQDERSSEIDLSGLIEPFKRGQNAAHRQGVGLGLTIVDSIAASHGGALSFSRCLSGTIAEFQIRP